MSADRLMVPAAHLHWLLTKGGFCQRGQTSPLGLQPPMGVVKGEAMEVIGELLWSHAAYQIKPSFMPARPLHNWHKNASKNMRGR